MPSALLKVSRAYFCCSSQQFLNQFGLSGTDLFLVTLKQLPNLSVIDVWKESSIVQGS